MWIDFFIYQERSHSTDMYCTGVLYCIILFFPIPSGLFVRLNWTNSIFVPPPKWNCQFWQFLTEHPNTWSHCWAIAGLQTMRDETLWKFQVFLLMRIIVYRWIYVIMNIYQYFCDFIRCITMIFKRVYIIHYINIVDICDSHVWIAVYSIRFDLEEIFNLFYQNKLYIRKIKSSLTERMKNNFNRAFILFLIEPQYMEHPVSIFPVILFYELCHYCTMWEFVFES